MARRNRSNSTGELVDEGTNINNIDSGNENENTVDDADGNDVLIETPEGFITESIYEIDLEKFVEVGRSGELKVFRPK